MTQIAQPESDTFVDDWDHNLGQGVDDLFAAIRITPLDDDPDPPTAFIDETFIVSETEPMNDVYVTKLEEIINPKELGDWVVKFRAQKMNNTGVNLDLTVQLRQGYVSEADQGELIHEEIFENIPFGFSDFEMNMTVADPITPSEPEADIDPTSIDTADLFVRLIADTA